MENMNFATHDSTPGPPAHVNSIPQSLGAWAQSPAMLPQWSYRSHLYPSQQSLSNLGFANSQFGTPQIAPYQSTGVPGVSQAMDNMASYNTTAGQWAPASVAQHSSNYTAHSSGAVIHPAGPQMHYAPRGPAIPSSTLQMQLGFAQQAHFTNRQPTSAAFHTQPRENSQVVQQPELSVPYFPAAAPYPTHIRHNSQPNPHSQQNVQGRSRPSQQHRHTHSTSGLNSSIDAAAPSASFSERRRQEHMRGRRPTSARFTVSEGGGDWARQFGGPTALYPSHRQANMNHTGNSEEADTRRLQLFRGAPTRGYMVSKSALQSLQTVELKDLQENDRTCVICYNEYCTMSPEGFRERPIRLPKCKHVFGSRCIRKWFQDSDSCPYCRDKLHSEPKQFPSSTRAFLNMMRIRGWAAGSEVAEDFYRRIMDGEDVQALVSVGRSTAERRPPPADGDDEDSTSRRTRRRRSSSSSVEPELPSPMQSSANLRRARPQTTADLSGQVSPTQAEAASNTWMFMALGSQGSLSQNVPLRYQSPARPTAQAVVHQPNSSTASSAANALYTRNFAPAVNAISNPLQGNTRASRIIPVAPSDASTDRYTADMYSSEEESA